MLTMTTEGPWLDDDQQRVWRGWLAMSSQLPAALHRQLQHDSGLSLQDFDVLVQLTESTEGRVRVSDLAQALGWERSRLSHHVKRMEGRGLVQREECEDDGRGAFVVVTPAGQEATELAAPAHAATVRDLVFTDLTDEDLAILAHLTETVVARLAVRRTG